ncbi:MAG: hypothetical protein E6I77_06975 [Chloroflexi bacterium]|nr:MAG: hypothetical protein E6I77_06975 [Chloroflexota bacterium]
MPELPELEALRIRMAPRLEGKLITAASVTPKKAHLLRYPVEEFARELPARRITSLTRRGKHLVFATEHGGGGYLDFRDMGRIYWVEDPAKDVPGLAELGPEADTVTEMGIEAFRKRLRRFRDELKDLLRNQEFLAGIGNAYSDEILFEARLLPLRRRASLKPAEEEALFAAIPTVLQRAVQAILANPNYEESKQDRSFMAVHMKGGKTCPRCGHRISQLGSNREPLNFCRGCQL